MSTNTRWIIGLLIILVLALGIALAVVTGGDDNDSGDHVTLPTITEPVPQTETVAPTVPTVTDDSGGVAPPSDSGGLDAP